MAQENAFSDWCTKANKIKTKYDLIKNTLYYDLDKIKPTFFFSKFYEKKVLVYFYIISKVIYSEK
ncbi:MAG: hypothetical protein HRU03_06655 [Nanoarchaeales archaeon]|nr:hypothetical protein [Nanoarchaeales archaeon]